MDLVTLGSRLFTDLEMLFATGERFVLKGVSHPTTDGFATTSDVPAAAFNEWALAHADHPALASGQVFIVPEGHDLTPQPRAYGFQPALDAATSDSEQIGLAAKGSPSEPEGSTMVTGAAPALPTEVTPLPKPAPADGPALNAQDRAEPDANGAPEPAPQSEAPVAVSQSLADAPAPVDAVPADNPNQDITRHVDG